MYQMTSKNNTNNQISKAIDILAGLRPNITREDKKSAIEELKVSPFIISTYLNGKGKNLSTAEKLIVFFNEKVSRRQKLFNQTLTAVTGA